MALKSKSKSKSEAVMYQSAAATFILPDSLPCSEVDFPVLTHRRPRANWHHILEERDQKMKEIAEYDNRDKTVSPKPPFLKTPCDYIENEVFGCLLSALENTLVKAKLWNAFHQPRCLFNGLDWIAQEIWNNNPRHPTRKHDQKHVFNMPWVRKHLAAHPRPLYPKSWLWTEEYAATVIQKTVRQYFVQREEEVQEMRDFWKKLETERENTDLQNNPFLAKHFASAKLPKPERIKGKKQRQDNHVDDGEIDQEDSD